MVYTEQRNLYPNKSPLIVEIITRTTIFLPKTSKRNIFQPKQKQSVYKIMN